MNPSNKPTSARSRVNWYIDAFSLLSTQPGALKRQITYPLLLFVHPPGEVRCQLPALGRIVHIN